MAKGPFPLTPLEQLPLMIDHDAIEQAYLPFLLDGEAGKRAWQSDYARRRRRALTRMIKRILGLKQRDRKAIQAEYHDAWSSGHAKYDVSAGPKKPAAWKWNTRRLALDGLAAARLRAPLLAAVIDRLQPRKVLEVGCGNGINLLSLAGHFPDVAFTGIDLTPAGIEAAKKVQRNQLLIFSRWCQVMLRFEKGMYEDPSQDLNKLWWDLVEKYQGLKRPEGRNAPDYASKIHICSAPVYYHNYMMGQLFASQVHHAIAKELYDSAAPGTVLYIGDKRVGDFMKRKVFEPGRTLSWKTLTRHATGEELSPKFFAKDFQSK